MIISSGSIKLSLYECHQQWHSFTQSEMDADKESWLQATHSYMPRLCLPLPPPRLSIPEIELWKFDQGLNLKSGRLFLHFNNNLRDGEQGNQGGIYCVDERSCGRMVLFSLSTSSSWPSHVLLHTGPRNMLCRPRTGGLSPLVSRWMWPRGFENYLL